MNTNVSPALVGVGAVFIDDIVLPTGKTYMAQLGGGVVHALMGAAVWGERPGIVALCGTGLPAAAREHLERHLDTRGLHELDIPQARAWQLFEEDGTRRELYRVREIRPFTEGAQPEHLPPEYRASAGFYLLQGFEGIRAWRAAVQGLILWEPLQQVMVPGARDALRATLQSGSIDIISPNLREARAVYGEQTADDLLTALFDDGAQVVALRMGADGSLIASRVTGEHHHIKAVPMSTIEDLTGAGNTYCGGLLAGILRGCSPREAACMGAVGASFCLEHHGALDPASVILTERDRRFKAIFDSSAD